MKTKRWKIYRCAVERVDGQRRWDAVYQFLLQCMIENREKISDEKSRQQEEQNGNSALCSCLNHTTTTGSDN